MARVHDTLRRYVIDNGCVPSAPSRHDSNEEEIADFLASYPPRLAGHCQKLRKIIRRTVPAASERIRPGWRLIGYDLPVNRHGRFFAWIWPEPEHVHIGWEVGTLLSDPEGLLRGAHLKLKKVRYLTYAPLDAVDAVPVVEFTRQAVEIVSMSPGERELLRMQRAGEAA
jgi:hypothetical protein